MELWAATPVIWYYHLNPVKLTGDMGRTMIDFGMEPLLNVAFQGDIYINHSLLILLIVALAIIYPVQKVMKLDIVNALRSR